MKVVVFGAAGQVGNALADVEPDHVDVAYVTRSSCDITDAEAVSEFINSLNPDYIINCAAYTAVDKAEEETELCYQVNRDAVQTIANCCKNGSSRRLIHISTDFVFDGKKSTPYMPDDLPNPLSVYGTSKLAGEQAIGSTIPDQTMIIRTAWVYYMNGGNFVNTMLRLMSDRDELSVVGDQRGAPTFARSLAEVIWRVIAEEKFTSGVYHWTDAGEISWYDFAVAIQEQGLGKGLLSKPILINPITTAEYPTAATRPAYSVLDCTSLELLANQKRTSWRDALGVMLKELSNQ